MTRNTCGTTPTRHTCAMSCDMVVLACMLYAPPLSAGRHGFRWLVGCGVSGEYLYDSYMVSLCVRRRRSSWWLARFTSVQVSRAYEWSVIYIWDLRGGRPPGRRKRAGRREARPETRKGEGAQRPVAGLHELLID